MPIEFALPTGQRINIHVKDAFIASPCVPEGNAYCTTIKVYPAEVSLWLGGNLVYASGGGVVRRLICCVRNYSTISSKDVSMTV